MTLESLQHLLGGAHVVARAVLGTSVVPIRTEPIRQEPHVPLNANANEIPSI